MSTITDILQNEKDSDIIDNVLNNDATIETAEEKREKKIKKEKDKRKKSLSKRISWVAVIIAVLAIALIVAVIICTVLIKKNKETKDEIAALASSEAVTTEVVTPEKYVLITNVYDGYPIYVEYSIKNTFYDLTTGYTYYVTEDDWSIVCTNTNTFIVDDNDKVVSTYRNGVMAKESEFPMEQVFGTTDLSSVNQTDASEESNVVSQDDNNNIDFNLDDLQEIMPIEEDTDSSESEVTP